MVMWREPVMHALEGHLAACSSRVAEAGHLSVFGNGDLAASPAGERDVSDVVVGESGGFFGNAVVHVQSL